MASKKTTTQQLTPAAQSSLGELLAGSGPSLSPEEQQQFDQAMAQANQLPPGSRERAISQLTQQRDHMLSSRGRQGGFLQQNFQDLAQMVGEGPGLEDVQRSVAAQREFAGRGGLAGGKDISNAQNFISQLFAPQEEALAQSFRDQQISADRVAGITGRGANDPILRNKLAQEQTRQQAMLGAQRTAATAQTAQQAAGTRVDLLSGLANQALNNRQVLSGLGSNLLAQERQFRLATGRNVVTEKKQPGLGEIIGAIGSGIGMVGGLFGGGGSGGGGSGGGTPNVSMGQASARVIPQPPTPFSGGGGGATTPWGPSGVNYGTPFGPPSPGFNPGQNFLQTGVYRLNSPGR